MRSLLCAFGFLTRIPLPGRVHNDEIALRRSAAFFPIVGLVLGCIYAITAWGLGFTFPPLVIAALLVTEDVLLTGALHLDGLADMADGFGGGKTKDDVLRIMRDHAIGSYGAVALITALSLKLACLDTLIGARTGLWFLFVTPGLSRWSMVLLSVLQPYARESTKGTGALAISIKRRHLLVASLICLAIVIGFGWRRCLICWTAVLIVSMLNAVFCRRHIGGITGDTLGANSVVCEVVQLFIAIPASHI